MDGLPTHATTPLAFILSYCTRCNTAAQVSGGQIPPSSNKEGAAEALSLQHVVGPAGMNDGVMTPRKHRTFGNVLSAVGSNQQERKREVTN